MKISEAKKIRLESILEKLGYMPIKIQGQDLYYFSPLRNEQEASFKINTAINAWYDFGLGEGGNIIDLVCSMQKCSVSMALRTISEYADERIKYFSLSPAKQIMLIDVEEKELTSEALMEYSHNRKIPFDLLRKYCKEVHYELKKRKYYGIGFKNDSGGYEIRNKYAKLNLNGKTISTLEYNPESPTINIYEGFFDFLSLLTIDRNKEQENHIILNSTANINKLPYEKLKNYMVISLYLDNDTTGDTTTAKLLESFDNARDERLLYKDKKDINDLLLTI